jgi:hypothetical protein
VWLEGLGKLKKSTSSGIRSRDLPVCSVVPQPTTPPRTPSFEVGTKYLFIIETNFEMGTVYSIYGEKRKGYMVLVGKLEDLGRPRYTWFDNITMDGREIRCGYMDWSHLARDRTCDEIL